MFQRAIICSVSLLAIAIQHAHAEVNFNRIASFDVSKNISAGNDRSAETAPEIITTTADGSTLIYTDSPSGKLGFIDIKNPQNPIAAGTVKLSGEPTSVSAYGATVFAGVNTSTNFKEPSGYLTVIDVQTKTEIGRCDLGGQPDSLAISKDGSFIVVAIENERDEDLNDGALPQLPAGNVVILPIENNALNCDLKTVVDLTGLADIAPEDPEPEFVDINSMGEIVLTLQENNHLVVLNKDGKILNHFSGGVATLKNIDIDEERALTFNATQKNRPREADSVSWIDNNHFATADEGDYKGGTRGWTIYNKNGSIVYDDNLAFEQALIEIGHYPEKRSGNKGIEPESIEFGQFGDKRFVFVGSERGSIVGVYELDGVSPQLHQLLPSGIAPEGILAIPSRNLLITANEKDLIEDKGPRAHVMIYELQEAPAAYPTITSKGSDELFGWAALSGLANDPESPSKLYAVNDNFFKAQPRIFTIDATQTPARITGYLDVTRNGKPAQKLDLEGITTDGKGGFWLASEGRSDREIPHAIYHVDAAGEIKEEIAFPNDLLISEKRFGAEGITLVDDTLWVAIQREWKDDPKGLVKLLSYNLNTKKWAAVHYPLDTPPAKSWVGLSEITAHDGKLYILERDNAYADEARVKRLYSVSLKNLMPAPLTETLPVVSKTLVHDLLPDLRKWNGFILDKVEGFTFDAHGNDYFLTDNDGVDDHSGETYFWKKALN